MIFSPVKIYTVHIKPEEGLTARPVFIREGFNVYAFAFSGFWALSHRLWKAMIVAFIFHFFTLHLLQSHILLKPSYLALELGFNFLFAMQANDWVRGKLAKKGYLFADVSASDNLLRAEQRYYERTLATQSA